MPELHLQRIGSTLDVILGEYKSSIPLADVVLNATMWEYIYDDAAAYGRDLFDKTFHDEQIRALLANLPTNERLLLVADDLRVAAVPWEYLRDQNNKLLASRLNFVRGLPEGQRRDGFKFTGPLEIVAIPVSPVNEPRVLNVEREWKNLVEAVTVTNPLKSLTLKRVRPPTRNQLERSLGRQCTSIVHFIGHSTSHDGKAFLAFEDARAHSHLVDSADFADSLNTRVFLVVLNSCLSAVVATTEFGNIAQTLVHRGFPYALGMQFILPDDAALVLSDALYDFLLQEHSVEEAVMHTRRALEEPGRLSNLHWLAGIPVLYTSLRTSAPPIKLTKGQPTIQPNPKRLEKTSDLTGLPQAIHFMGRGKEISEVLDALLAQRPADFVVLHGLGGIGKTSLARTVAERISWYYGDRVLAVSFETFATLDTQGQVIVDEYFADRFYNQLAHFYDLDPVAYTTTVDLQRAILQRRLHCRSMLVLDNIETLIDAQKKGHPAAKALATFISRLKEGGGVILLTSRILPPIDWGDCKIISVSGLSDDAGGSLLLALLPPDRRAEALPEMHRKLSQRVKGHPLSIRLLAGRFAEATTDLETFLKEIDEELQAAEQITPTSMEDPNRQATLYACMDYSVKRLTPEQRKVLDAISLFQAQFLPEFAVQMMNDEEQTPVHLEDLVHLGLLNKEVTVFKEGELILLNLHPMLRWYIQHSSPERDMTSHERYGQVYEHLARQAYQPERGYDQSSLMRYLVRQSLPDCEAALKYLPPPGRSSLAYHLAKPYRRLGQNRRALALYEQALELYQELGDMHSIAVTQHTMADVLSQQGQPQEALALYEQSLRIDQELGDVRGVALTQSAKADVLSEQGQPQEALALYKQSLRTAQELGDVRSVAATQHAMADVLNQQGQSQEALALYEQALRTEQELGDVRSVAVTQSSMADVLRPLDKPQEALALYEQALRTKQELGDIREVAMTQSAIADVLSELGKPQEALAVYEQALRTMQKLGDIREVAATQANYCQLLFQQGGHNRALVMAWDAYTSLNQHGYLRDTQIMQQLLMSIKGQILGSAQFDALWTQVMSEPQPNWLRDVQQAQRINRGQDAEFFADILAILDYQDPPLPEGHPYADAIESIQVGIAAEGPQGEGISVDVSDEVMQAVHDFVNAEDWDATRQVAEAQQAILFQPEVEALFEQNIAHARPTGEERAVNILEQRLDLLRACKTIGIAEAFERLTAAQDGALLFDAELIPRSIAALLGVPQEKMVHTQYLTAMANETTDEDLKALITTIQLALFSNDLSQLGRDLKGVYRQSWETIAASVEEGGVDPQLFNMLTSNTLAALGPASNQRNEWRKNISELRNQATALGHRNMVALLDAVIGLLDAGGHPAGLGEGMQGIYAKTWQKIVEQIEL